MNRRRLVVEFGKDDLGDLAWLEYIEPGKRSLRVARQGEAQFGSNSMKNYTSEQPECCPLLAKTEPTSCGE